MRSARLAAGAHAMVTTLLSIALADHLYQDRNYLGAGVLFLAGAGSMLLALWVLACWRPR